MRKRGFVSQVYLVPLWSSVTADSRVTGKRKTPLRRTDPAIEGKRGWMMHAPHGLLNKILPYGFFFFDLISCWPVSRMASRTLNSTWLLYLSAGTTGVHHQAWAFTWVLRPSLQCSAFKASTFLANLPSQAPPLHSCSLTAQQRVERSSSRYHCLALFLNTDLFGLVQSLSTEIFSFLL